MLYYTIGQWRIFVTMVLCGMAAGAWYGLLARTAQFLKSGVWLNAFIDLLIALGIWLIILVGLLITSYGEVRLYPLLGVALGFALYRLTIAQLLNLLLKWVARFLTWLVKFLGNRKVMKYILK